MVMRSMCRVAVSASIPALLIACGLSEAERTARAADSIVAIAASQGHVVRSTVAGRPLALMVHDCVVHNLADAPRKDGRRPAVLKPEFYPWPTFCMRQSISADTAWATVTLGRTAFGAGGCCATGGTYRTRDGRAWEKEGSGGRWTALARDTAP